MAQDLDKLRARLEGLKELAQHAAPKDRARLYRTIYLNAVAIETLADARQATQRGMQRRIAAEVEEARLRMQEEAVLAELLVLRDNQNPSSSDNLPYIRWWSSVRWASWCQARSRQRRGPKGPGFTSA